MKMLLAAVFVLVGFQSFAQEQEQEQKQEQEQEQKREVAQENPPLSSSSEAREWKFAAGLGIATSSNLTFNDGKKTNAGAEAKLEADLDFKSALVLNVEVRNMAPRSWGFIGGLQFDTTSEIDGGTIKEDGTSYTLDPSSDSKLQISNLFANAVYQWDQLYLPFGFNYSRVNFTPNSGFSGSSDYTGGLGMQFGLGVLVNEHLAFETQIRTIQVNAKSFTSSGVYDYGMGFLGSWVLVAKYIF